MPQDAPSEQPHCWALHIHCCSDPSIHFQQGRRAARRWMKKTWWHRRCLPTMTRLRASLGALRQVHRQPRCAIYFYSAGRAARCGVCCVHGLLPLFSHSMHLQSNREKPLLCTLWWQGVLCTEVSGAHEMTQTLSDAVLSRIEKTLALPDVTCLLAVCWRSETRGPTWCKCQP